MKVRGTIFTGVMRGNRLIHQYYNRLVGILGCEPFEGTMDVQLSKKVDIAPFSTKSVEHKLLDGSDIIHAHLAPVKLHFRARETEEEAEEEQQEAETEEEPEDQEPESRDEKESDSESGEDRTSEEDAGTEKGSDTRREIDKILDDYGRGLRRPSGSAGFDTVYECWTMQQVHKRIYEEDVVEVIAEDELKKKFGLKDGDEIVVEFTHEVKPKKKSRKLFNSEGRLSV